MTTIKDPRYPPKWYYGRGLLGLGDDGGLGAQTVAVAEEEDALASALSLSAGLDPLAHASASEESADETSRTVLDVCSVVLAHNRLDSLGGLVGVVKGDVADVVVEDVGLDDTVEEMSTDEAHLAIDGSSGTTDKVPLLASVVGKGRVGVLEEGDGNYCIQSVYENSCWNAGKLTEPVVDPEVGNKVPDKHVGEAIGLAEVGKTDGSDGNTNVAQDNELSIAVLVQRASGIEVVDTTAKTVMLALATPLTLALMVVVAGNVGHEVVGPANELLHDEHEESEDGSLLSQLRKLVGKLAKTGGLLLASAGNENHVALHVAGGLVVLSVGDLPAEVGNEEGRVKNPTGDVVDKTGVGESTGAALVGNNPDTGSEKTLKNGVHAPEESSHRSGGDVLGGDKVVPDAESGGKADEIAEDVGVSFQGRSLEAVLGDSIVDVLDGEIRGSELVAVGVEEFAIAGLGLVGVYRRERGERGRRGGRSRRIRRTDSSRGLGVVGSRGRGGGASESRALPGGSSGRSHCERI